MGYIGPWMSKRAQEAIKNNVKPKALWGAKKLIKAVLDDNPDLDRELLEAMDLQTLRDKFLTYSEWHHMGADYRKVAFYRVSAAGYTNEYLLDARKLAA